MYSLVLEDSYEASTLSFALTLNKHGKTHCLLHSVHLKTVKKYIATCTHKNKLLI